MRNQIALRCFVCGQVPEHGDGIVTLGMRYCKDVCGSMVTHCRKDKRGRLRTREELVAVVKQLRKENHI